MVIGCIPAYYIDNTAEFQQVWCLMTSVIREGGVKVLHVRH